MRRHACLSSTSTSTFRSVRLQGALSLKCMRCQNAIKAHNKLDVYSLVMVPVMLYAIRRDIEKMNHIPFIYQDIRQFLVGGQSITNKNKTTKKVKTVFSQSPNSPNLCRY